MRRCFAPLLLLPILLLAACDAGTPDPPWPAPYFPPEPEPGPPPGVVVTVVRPLLDQTMFDNESRRFWLPGVFSQQDDVRLTYSAEVTGGAVTTEITAADYLVLTPAAVGEAVVYVTARDTTGATAADTLTVRVLDPCPAPPPEGWEDRFPMDSLTQWNFSGATTRVWPTHTDSTLYRGDLRLTTRGCQDGTRRYEMRIRRTTPRPTIHRYTVVESFDRTLTYAPSTSPAFARFAPAAEPDTLLASAFLSRLADVFCDDVPNPNPREVRVVAGRGPVLIYGTGPVTHTTYGQGVLTCAVRNVSMGIP